MNKLNHADTHLENDRDIVGYEAKWDEYFITLSVDESSGIRITQQIYFCPWCGVGFPDGKSKQWHEALEQLGVDPMIDDVPVEFRDATWWKQSDHTDN